MAYNADKAPLELTALTSLASDDTIIVGDTSDVSEVAKSITKANLITTLGTGGALAALDTVSATEIDDEAVTLAKMAHIATDRILGRTTAGTGDVEALTAVQAADTIGVGTGDSPQFTGVNVGHATDTTISRVSAGVIAVEGTNVSLAGHTHTASEVTDFDTEVANNSAVTANTAKLTANTANVTAAGALMDSEVTNLAQVKAFDTTDYATAAQGSTADSALQNVSEDTTPQLGGELDAQANSIGFTMQSATGDGTTTIDWGNGNHFDFTFGAQNDVFTFTAPAKSGVYTLTLKQDSVGSRTATFPASVKWAGGTAPTLTTTATTGYDIISFRFDGTNYYGVASLDFS